MNTLTDKELGWIIGLLEGEGWFGTRKGQPVIRCSMTDKDVIDRLRNLCGGRTCIQKAVQEHWKPIHIWYLHGNSAADLMSLVLPEMGERRGQKITSCLNIYKQHQEKVLQDKNLRAEPGRQAGLAYLNGEGSLRQLAKRFKVSQVTVLNYYRKLL